MNLSSFSHRRFNPLLGEWVLVACNRIKRPWPQHPIQPQLQTLTVQDSNCSLCPGTAKMGQDKKTPLYDLPCVFDHDYPSLLADIPLESMNEQNVLIAEGEHGLGRIVSYGPQHDLFLGSLSIPFITDIINIWENQIVQLGLQPDIAYVSVFENRQSRSTSHLHHPHCEILASRHIPSIVKTESAMQKDYFDLHHHCLLCTYVKIELEMQSRVIVENNEFIAITPFWAQYAEIIILPKKHYADISDMSTNLRLDFAEILHLVCAKFEKLFSKDEPFFLAVHQSPEINSTTWHFHVHLSSHHCNTDKARNAMNGYSNFFSQFRDNSPEEVARNFRNITNAL